MAGNQYTQFPSHIHTYSFLHDSYGSFYRTHRLENYFYLQSQTEGTYPILNNQVNWEKLTYRADQLHQVLEKQHDK